VDRIGCRRRNSFFSTMVAGLFALLTQSASADPARGLPPLEISQDDSSAAAQVALGRKLFMDRRLSRNGTMSCGMCHVPEQGFTTNEMATTTVRTKLTGDVAFIGDSTLDA